MYKYVQEFRLLFTSFLSINIIIFVHTFVKMTRYLHMGCWVMLCFSLYSVTCVKHGTTTYTYRFYGLFSGIPQNMSFERKKHENLLVKEVRAREYHEHEHRNSKLIEKANKTLISSGTFWFALKKGFKFQYYLLLTV